MTIASKIKIRELQRALRKVKFNTVDAELSELDTALLLKANVTHNHTAGSTLGNEAGGHYAEFQADGSLIFYGNATAFRDEFGPLIGAKLESPSSKIITNAAEGTITFKDTSALTDYVSMPVQLNHDTKTGSQVYPHIHWWQTSANIPNWLLQYRFQVNGAAKNTSWSPIKYVSHAFTYSSGTLNQITAFGALSLPEGAGVSTILQLRLLRDTANTSTLFAGADPLTGDVDAMFYDVHIEVDMLGSREQYTK